MSRVFRTFSWAERPGAGLRGDGSSYLLVLQQLVAFCRPYGAGDVAQPGRCEVKRGLAVRECADDALRRLDLSLPLLRHKALTRDLAGSDAARFCQNASANTKMMRRLHVTREIWKVQPTTRGQCTG
jgi:hypothetical protein